MSPIIAAALLCAPATAGAQAPAPPLREPIFKACRPWCELGPPGPYTPERAARMGVPGAAQIECLLRADGRLTGCRLIEEHPQEMGFREAALRMAQAGYLTAQPRTESGVPVEERVRVVVEFPMKRVRK